MKIAIHFTKGNWHTFKKVKAIATTDNFVILTKLDGDVKVFDRNIIKHIKCFNSMSDKLDEVITKTNELEKEIETLKKSGKGSERE